MKFFISSLLLLTSLVTGEVIFRSNAHIIKDTTVEKVEEQSLETSLQPNIEEIVKKKRVLRKIERVIEPREEAEERKLEDFSLENPESVYYINRNREIFIHPKSVLDLRKVLNFSNNEPLYYGLEGKLDTVYTYPFRMPEGGIVYYGTELEQTPKSIEIQVDSKVPELVGFEFIGNSYKTKNGKVYYGGSDLKLKVSAKDNESGVKSIRVFNEKEELIFSNQALFEQEKNWETVFEISSENFKEIIFEIEDNVTNVFRSEKIPVLIDLTPPKVQIQIEPESSLDLENETCALGSKLSVTARDEQTHVKEIQFRYPNSDWKKYISRLILNKPGIYRMEFRAIDYFGNTSLPEYFECKVLEP